MDNTLFWKPNYPKIKSLFSEQLKPMIGYYSKIEGKAIDQELKQIIAQDIAHAMNLSGTHEDRNPDFSNDRFYNSGDFRVMQHSYSLLLSTQSSLKTIEDLLDMDKEREKDGLPKKIRIGNLVNAKKDGNKVIVVPTTTEDKLVHDPTYGLGLAGTATGGAGDGEIGEVIGEVPVNLGEHGFGPGDAESGSHDIESKTYELGQMLSKKFNLPNVNEKRMKRAIIREKHDLTDINKGSGQILDKKATLKEIVKRNIGIGRLKDPKNINPLDLIVDPKSKIYKILSKETDYLAAATVFLVRDYSGSMGGTPSQTICTQHLFIYSWLKYQYEKLATPRFILHDTEAIEVPDFHTYYNKSAAGGTNVSSSFKKVNEIVEKEGLARDYNIYVFYGGDGDDWTKTGEDSINELEKMVKYSSRIGLTVLRHGMGFLESAPNETSLEGYIKSSGLLEKYSNILKMDAFNLNEATEERLIAGIKKLVSEEKLKVTN